MQKVGGIGGSERHLLSLLPALAEAGVDVQMFVAGTGRSDQFTDRLRDLGIGHSIVSAGPDANPRLVAALRREIRTFRPPWSTRISSTPTYTGCSPHGSRGYRPFPPSTALRASMSVSPTDVAPGRRALGEPYDRDLRARARVRGAAGLRSPRHRAHGPLWNRRVGMAEFGRGPGGRRGRSLGSRAVTSRWGSPPD